MKNSFILIIVMLMLSVFNFWYLKPKVRIDTAYGWNLGIPGKELSEAQAKAMRIKFTKTNIPFVYKKEIVK